MCQLIGKTSWQFISPWSYQHTGKKSWIIFLKLVGKIKQAC